MFITWEHGGPFCNINAFSFVCAIQNKKNSYSLLTPLCRFDDYKFESSIQYDDSVFIISVVLYLSSLSTKLSIYWDVYYVFSIQSRPPVSSDRRQNVKLLMFCWEKGRSFLHVWCSSKKQSSLFKLTVALFYIFTYIPLVFFYWRCHYLIMLIAININDFNIFTDYYLLRDKWWISWGKQVTIELHHLITLIWHE